LILHPAIGVEKIFKFDKPIFDADHKINVLSMGRLVPLKGFHLGVAAFAKLLETYPDAKLTIVGKGRGLAIHELVDKLHINQKVNFIEWLPRDEALRLMENADVFLFPTFEGGGMVVLEAMAHGLPVVALNYGGPAYMASSDCAILVSPGDMDTTVSSLAEGLRRLAVDPDAREKMGSAAITRIEKEYLWSNRHEAIREWYQASLDRQPGLTR
jgi:glycosyltransferase involved in cell wall biosynthesis